MSRIRNALSDEAADLYWKWLLRGGVALLLLLANVLLALVIINVSDAFETIDRIGETAESLEIVADTIDALAVQLGENAERVVSTVESAGEDAARARDVLEKAGTDVTRATDALEDARADFERTADDFGRIADTLEEAFTQ